MDKEFREEFRKLAAEKSSNLTAEQRRVLDKLGSVLGDKVAELLLLIACIKKSSPGAARFALVAAVNGIIIQASEDVDEALNIIETARERLREDLSEVDKRLNG